jgi:predicted permease
MLTRAIGRSREFALRAAIGARRSDLLRQLLAEALVVAVAGSIVGFVLASLALSSLLELAPSSLPRRAEIGIQPATFVFLSVASLVVAAGCAVVAAFRAGSEGAVSLVTDAGTRATAGRQQRRLLAGTAVFQVGMALALVLLSSLFVRAFVALDRLDVGFSRDRVVTMHLPLGYTFGDGAEKRRNFFRELVTRIDALPGVDGAGLVLMRPLEMEQGWDFEYTLEGQDDVGQKSNPSGNLLSATPGYFDAMMIGLRAGRLFSEADRPDTTKVALVSESFASRHGGARAVVGKRIKSGKVDSEKPWVEVIGVVADVRYRAMTLQKPDIYVPYTQTNWSPNYLAVRTGGNPSQLLGPVRSIVRELDPSIAVANEKTTAQLVGAKLAQPKLNAAIVALFAIASVALAVVGLYSVVAYDARTRSAELGIRAAVGASRRDLMTLVLRGAATIAVPGIALGVGGALLLRALLATMLPGSEPFGAGLIAAASAAMLAVAIVASVGPAWRASGIDPVRALRHD